MDSDKQKRNKSIFIAVGIHLVLLLVFFFMLAWTAPDPPIPQYGIDLDLSLSDAQVEKDDKPISAETPTEESEVKDPTEEIETVESQPTEPVDSPVEDVVDPDEAPDEQMVTEDINSPDVIERETNEQSVKDAQPSKVEEKENLEEKKEEKAPVAKPSIDQRAILKKADPGTGGGSQGSTLDLSGWMWDERPNPDDRSAESGRIVFQISVDDIGEIISVKTIEKTVSPAVEKVYRDAVMELTFSPTGDNRSTAPVSTGKITFIIKSK